MPANEDAHAVPGMMLPSGDEAGLSRLSARPQPHSQNVEGRPVDQVEVKVILRHSHDGRIRYCGAAEETQTSFDSGWDA